MGSLAVVGSINMDLVLTVVKAPGPGETVKSAGTAFLPGGKGANQAVAAARSGANVYMIGAVGNDAFGPQLAAGLKDSGVDTAHVRTKPGTSGLAFIAVEESGENRIVLSGGANDCLDAEELRRSLAACGPLQAVLLQNEIGWEMTSAMLAYAGELGIPVLYNAAPAVSIPADAYSSVHTLSVNESEAEALAGYPVISREDAERAAQLFLDQGVSEVLVTLGATGVVYRNREGKSYFQTAFSVKAVDTTAAGDTFFGAYAAALAAGRTLEERLRFAAAAAALSVTRLGAQASIPAGEDVERFLETRE